MDDREQMTQKVKEILGIFTKVGIAPKECFDLVPEQYHPRNLLPGFEMVIVFAEGNKNDYQKFSYMGSFKDYLGTLAAQSDTVRYLKSLGYRAEIIPGSTRKVSLVRMGIQAGLGELSPVNSLLVKDYGLTTTLAAIITDAPLISDKTVSGICINCGKCIRVCPARDVPYASVNPDQCGCGKCRTVCPA